ncbi:MAG: hemolysin family protein [Chloroflexi bacterium]|nr:hemolysin family protein [Chloroflexota bacterium]MCC6895742.1 HlyC/CorC family transporter [Anaerolineae bacterium]
MGDLLGVLSVFFLVATNGFFVAAEFSLVGARRTRIAQLASEGNSGAKVAQKAMEHLDAYIAATQLGITLSSLGLGWVGEPAIGHLIEPLLESLLPHESVETVAPAVSFAIAFSIVTLLHIVMGELVPKSIALQRPEATSIVVARPVTWFLVVFRPIIHIMNGLGNGIVRLLGFEPSGEHSSVHSAEELEMLVHSSREAGLLQENEEVLLRRVFDFSDITVEEIMQPRVNVEGLSSEATFGELLDMMTANKHSRYPVYEETIDNVVGLILSKDILDMIIHKPDLLTNRSQKPNFKPYLREPLFVPQTLGVDILLERMQESKTHLAVVIDEYGGMAGVATMEDIIEQLVGEVQDEYDDEEVEVIQAEGQEIIVDGMMSMTEAVERFGQLAGEFDSTTLGGYIAEQLDRIPEVNDTVSFGGYKVSVREMDGLRVAKVRFSKRPQSAASTDAGAPNQPENSET